MKKNILALILFFILISGCRDYFNDLDSAFFPVLFTDIQAYSLNDSIIVALQNNSSSAIYTTEILNSIEKKVNGNWILYESYSCSNCSEFAILKNQLRSVKSKPVQEAGFYRFVCLYSNVSGTEEQQKMKLYSNEFSIY